MDPQFEVLGDEASGRVDYAIKKVIDVVNEELIAITEGKQKGFGGGIHAEHNATRKLSPYKHETSVAFDDEFDYLYGIVTTASAHRKGFIARKTTIT